MNKRESLEEVFSDPALVSRKQAAMSPSNREAVPNAPSADFEMLEVLDQQGSSMLTCLWVALDAYAKGQNSTRPPVVLQSAAVANVLGWRTTTTQTYFKRLVKRGLISTRRKMGIHGMGFVVYWVHPEVEAFIDLNRHMLHKNADDVIRRIEAEEDMWK